MPIYEFYCRSCHTIFSFLSRKVDASTVPSCPKDAQHVLTRQVSRFAISKGLGDPAESSELPPGFDEQGMETAMLEMASQFEGANEEDPRTMAQMMRTLMDRTGMNLGEGMQEAIRRMEAGEDPDKVEDELGDVLEAEDPFEPGESTLKGIVRRFTEAPNEDPDIYDM